MKKLLIIIMLFSTAIFAGEYKDIVVEKTTDKVVEVRCSGNIDLLKEQYNINDYNIVNTKLSDVQLQWLKSHSKYLKYINSILTLDQAQKDADDAQDLEDSKDFELRFDPLLKAFALVVLDEINLLRVEAGLSERTVAQLKTAVKNKL